MKSRIEGLVGPDSLAMWIGTFHAMMLRILRRFAALLGYDRSFTILDVDDQQKIIKSCLTELNYDEKAFAPKVVHSQISAAKNALIGVDQYAREAGQDFRLSRIARVYSLYQDKLKKSNSMDFDDILCEAVRLLSEHPEVLAEYQDRFRYILVDEYQDTNHAQYRLVRLLSDHHRNLCVVGDDDQSIYSFRGANIQNILDFEKDFKGCKVIKLEQNYRSTAMVLNAANAVIKENKGRKAKRLWTSSGAGEPITFLRAENHSEEGRYIAAQINSLVTRSDSACAYRDIAVLYRLNALSRSLESALREQGIPYRIFGGMRFYDRKEIKDVLGYLRLILLPGDDLALNRIIQVPRRGIGDTTLEQLAFLAAREGKSQLAICTEASAYQELQRAAARLQSFAGLISQLRSRLLANDLSLAEYIEWVESESGLVQELVDQQGKSRLDDPVDRIENLKELLSDALEFTAGRQELRALDQAGGPEDQDLLAQDLPSVLASFLERAALYAEMDEDRENQDYVRLMTIHSAKGLEFGTVFLVGAEEGLFPGYRSMENEADIEEERRLAYVAITRAKRKLYITTARSRLVFGQTQNLSVSRFAQEIPSQCLEEIGGSRFRDSGAEFGRSAPAGRAKFPGMPEQNRPIPDPIRPAAPSPRTSAPIDLQKGDAVRHARFGTGRIVSCEPVAGDAIVIIEFESGDRKRLLARMANLEKI